MCVRGLSDAVEAAHECLVVGYASVGEVVEYGGYEWQCPFGGYVPFLAHAVGEVYAEVDEYADKA